MAGCYFWGSKPQWILSSSLSFQLFQLCNPHIASYAKNCSWFLSLQLLNEAPKYSCPKQNTFLSICCFNSFCRSIGIIGLSWSTALFAQPLLQFFSGAAHWILHMKQSGTGHRFAIFTRLLKWKQFASQRRHDAATLFSTSEPVRVVIQSGRWKSLSSGFFLWCSFNSPVHATRHARTQERGGKMCSLYLSTFHIAWLSEYRTAHFPPCFSWLVMKLLDSEWRMYRTAHKHT